MGDKVIMYDGSLVDLASYQKISGLKDDMISENFSLKEKKIGEFRPCIYAIPLIQLVQVSREMAGRPLVINSGYRTHEKQAELLSKGYRAAKTSPHEYGMAFDIDTRSYKETIELVKILRSAASELLDVKIRIGYLKYWTEDKSTFVHVDVCPMYYAEGRPYHKNDHPIQWEKEIVW